MKKILEKTWLRYLIIAVIVVLSFFDALAAAAMLFKVEVDRDGSDIKVQLAEQAFITSADYICVNDQDGLFYAYCDDDYYRIDEIHVTWADEIKYSLAANHMDKKNEDFLADTAYQSFSDVEEPDVRFSSITTMLYKYNDVAKAYVCTEDYGKALDTKYLTVNDLAVIGLSDYSGKYFFVKYPEFFHYATSYIFLTESFNPNDAGDIRLWKENMEAKYHEDFYNSKNIQEEREQRIEIYRKSYNFFGPNPEYVFFALTGVIILLGLYVLASVGHKKDFDGIYLTVWDNVGWSIHGLLMCVIMGVSALPMLILDEMSGYDETLRLIIALCFACMVVVLAGGWFLETTLVRLKAKCFWKTTTIGYLVNYTYKPFKRWGASIKDYFLRKKDGRLGIDLLANETAAIVCGEKENVDTSVVDSHYRNFADNINALAEGKTKAIEEMLKSERMRVELITNVSHDIKTPLTSIISYTELLSGKDIDDAEALEYLEVISGQSKRLKTLLEDLIEASKASSGVLKVKMEELKIDILLTQILCEYEDQMEERGLKLISNLGEDIKPVLADGKHLSRVFYNIFTNVTKYALEGSRVYVDVSQTDRTVVTVKNTSASQLNISPEELKERFMRGDSSRTSEGSGLGLAIAESLMELMGGKLDIEIDGDLFKVSVIS